MDTLSKPNSATKQVDNLKAIKVCFVSLPHADQETFKRVITFCAARGQHFEITSSANADVLITDDQATSIQAAQNEQDNNLLLVVSNDQNCESGDIQLQRPLLVTRVMRTMETLAKQVTPRIRKPDALLPTEPLKDPTSPTPAPDNTNNNKSASVSPTKEQAATTGRSYLALVIDDSSAIRKQLEIELRTSGLRSEFAESGEEALEKILTKSYDLIFLDIMMPGIDGYETCEKIRKNPSYKKTPVIMLSGKTSPLDEVKGVLAGASTYLTKPIKHQQFQEVTQRITRWLGEFR